MINRETFDIDLRPAVGSRFQPTGFPDIGAAVFQRPDGEGWVDCLLVESAQSMANRLEEVGWNDAAEAPAATLDGLPYVRVVAADDGRYLTSSRTEAHRLASAFIKDSSNGGGNMRDAIREQLGLRDDTPLAPREVAGAIFKLDPLCLVHGVFFADKAWPGQPRVARALTAFIEAVDVRPAVSGGVKRDEVRHTVEGKAGATEGYGFVPFHRTEWAARRITASFSVDLAQLRSYGLAEPATALLSAIARWEMRSLLDGGLRLRTACDLVAADPASVDQVLPPLDDLARQVRQLIGQCRDELGSGGSLDVVWSAKKAKA
jgi:CRISPR-associated protein Csb1